jgi:hypothetical protein
MVSRHQRAGERIKQCVAKVAELWLRRLCLKQIILNVIFKNDVQATHYNMVIDFYHWMRIVG